MKLAQDFRAFLTKQNVLALAIAVVIGAAIGKVVSGIVEDVLMPLIGVLLPGGGWRTAQLALAEGNAIKYGDLLGRVVDFLIISFVVFVITRALIKEPPKPPAAPTKKCPYCLESIPLEATRCRACTSEQPAQPA